MKWMFIIVLFFFISEAQVSQQPDARMKKDSQGTPSLRLNQQGSNVFTVFKNIEHGIQKCAVQ